MAVLPETGAIDPALAETIREFVADGGSLLVTGDSSLHDGEFRLGDVLGISYDGRYPYSTTYIDLQEYDEEVPAMECVSYDGFHRVVPDSATVMADIVAPTTERSETRRFSHYQAPPERTLDLPAITHNQYGDGEAVYVGTSLFTQYYDEDYHVHRTILDNVLSSLQTRPTVELDAPTSVAVNLMSTSDARYAHFTNYHSARPGAYLPQIDTRGETTTSVTARVLAPDMGTATPVTDASVSTDRDGEYLEIDIEDVHFHEIVRID